MIIHLYIIVYLVKVDKIIHALDKDPGNKEAEHLMLLLIPLS